MTPGLFTDDAGCGRCFWCQASAAYQKYHDTEWGFPVKDERRLFEKICLEGFQAGLSWLTILNKRGWTFVGPTTMYAFMQAMGLVNDHIKGCHSRHAALAARSAFKPPTV